MINIALCFDDNFIMPAGVLITSICLSNKLNNITFYIISDSLSKENSIRLNNIVNQYTNKKISIINITTKKLQELPIHISTFTLATYYRLLLPELLPVELDKVLYLDCDMLVVDDLSELYNLDISSYSSAITADMFYDDEKITNRLGYSVKEHYYNAGMLLINLNYWRKNHICDKTMNYVLSNKEKCLAHDQDAINAILHGTILDAPYRFNVQIDFLKKITKLIFSDKAEMKKAQNSSFNPAIIHYTGPSKPWKFQNYNPYADLWYYFQSKTIWKNLPKTHEFHGFKLFKWHIKHFLEIMHLRHKRVDEYINMSEVNQKILKLYNN